MELVFATHNQNKVIEVQEMMPEGTRVLSLNDIHFTEEIPEDFETLEENALKKARVVYQKSGFNCFADDTGLEVELLHGAPGVRSARYAGEPPDPGKNIELLLKNLEGENNRAACFRTVIALILNGKEQLFEGIVSGEIIKDKRGNMGFGYDPVFLPNGELKTFAQMPLFEKNRISHRARAIVAMAEFLAGYTLKMH